MESHELISLNNSIMFKSIVENQFSSGIRYLMNAIVEKAQKSIKIPSKLRKLRTFKFYFKIFKTILNNGVLCA